MKIGFTGGGSGGHFYPIIAVAQRIHEFVEQEKLLEPELIYFAPTPYDKKALFDQGIRFVPISAGKIRRYFSLKNIIDLCKTGWGSIYAFWRVLFIFPDVIFSTGSYVSFPTLLAARLFKIPVVIHESDTTPGRANAWAAKFATKIGVSFKEAVPHFEAKLSKKQKVRDSIAVIGHPIRKELLIPADRSGREYLKLEENTPVIFVLGGSLGAQALNESIVDTFPGLLERYQVVHQTGSDNFEDIQKLAGLALETSQHQSRYKPVAFLDTLSLRMAAGAADLIISRAGAGALFEIAVWGKPSIIIPISKTVSHNQRENAFVYARAGATDVIEEENLTPNLLTSEINRLMNDEEKRAEMAEAAKAFSVSDAAQKVARELLDIALSHEQ